MSRRKQDKPQPRKHLLEVEEGSLQDILTCGGCQKDFCLSEIVQFIAHKVQRCNKENFEMAPLAVRTPISAKLAAKADASKRAVVDADTNTDNEPANYVCCTCKQAENSAWSLLQHVQNVHGLKIYVDSPRASSAPAPPAVNGNDSSSSQPLTVDTSPTSQFSLLRMPLGERQFGTPLNSHNFFPRPPANFGMDLLTDQFHRMNHHHHTSLPFDPHFERAARTFEPQLDFYSQRLRQLAGATSPNPTPSPRKLTPPFSQSSTVCSRPSSNPSTPTPQPSLPPAQKAQQSSCSSTSSKMSEQQGSPKLKSCEFCGKSFRFQSNLAVHRRSHTGEKPYKCSICNHSCSQSSKLKRHMKTHKLKISGNGSENNSLLSPRSTPESDPTKDNDDLDDSDGQTADNEEEEEEDFDDDDDLLEEDEDNNTDANSEMIAEDLSTRGMNNSTPNICNNISKDKNETKHSILGEVMENIGLNNIQQYTEAYHQALEESSVPKAAVKLEKAFSENESNNNVSSLSSLTKSIVENGPSKDDHNMNQILGVPSLDFSHGMLGTFDHPFDPGSKRLKLDLGVERGESLYAGLWRPTSHRDLLLGTNDCHKSIADSAFKSALTLASSRPSTSANLLATSPGPNKIKTDRRNDTCEYCGKIFKNCSNLTVHRRSHTGEKPYKCGLCSYACAQSSKLTRHMKTHGRMGKDVYRCRFCDMPFSVPSTLEKHMRKCVVHQNVVGMLADKDSDSKETT